MTQQAFVVREWETLELKDVFLSDDHARDIAERLKKRGAVEITELRTGLFIRARAHVGRISLGALQLTIQPKIAEQSLLALVRYVLDVNELALIERTRFETTGHLFQDLIAAQLHAEVKRLIARGLLRRYVTRIDALSSPRGRFQFRELVARPLVDATLVCRHDQRQVDHVLNRVVLGGVRLAESLVGHTVLRGALARTRKQLALEVSEPPRLTKASIAAAWRACDRLAVGYEPVLGLIELLLAGRALSLDDDDDPIDVPGFLFDMNRFFQALLGRFLRDHLVGYEVRDEQGLRRMMSYAPDANPRRRRDPTPRPDFAVLAGKQVVALLDSKYSDLWNFAISRDMLYQLAIYAASQGAGATATILYPAVDRTATLQVINIAEPISGRSLGRIAIRPVDLVRMVEILHEGTPRSEAARMAHALVFG